MEHVRCLVVLLVSTTVLAEEFYLEYYTTVSMDCDDSKYNFTSSQHIEKRYWLLPDSSLLQSGQNNKHVNIDSNFTLTINKIDDNDFGYYFCLVVRSDHSVDRIRHGLNVNGPYFGDLLEKYRKNAIIGGIAAGTLFVIVAGTCLVWHMRYQTRERKNKAVDELDKAIHGFDLKAYDNVGLDNTDITTDTKLDAKPKLNGPEEKEEKL